MSKNSRIKREGFEAGNEGENIEGCPYSESDHGYNRAIWLVGFANGVMERRAREMLAQQERDKFSRISCGCPWSSEGFICAASDMPCTEDNCAASDMPCTEDNCAVWNFIQEGGNV